MKKYLFIILFVFEACLSKKVDKQDEKNPKSAIIISENYELIITKKQYGFLILFPCFPCNAKNTSTQFNIIDIATANNISVLLMNFNQHLWLSNSDKKDLEKIIIDAVNQYGIKIDNTYIGGFSSGGNVTLLLTDYLKLTESSIQPKGLFIADSPVDLLGLYKSSQKAIEKNISVPAVQEANWINETFNLEFGTGDTSFTNYENKSPYFSSTNSTKNISNLNGLKIRLYSEPDTLWWKRNRQADYEDMNAYYLEQLANDLGDLYGVDQVTYITTKNRGYRANGNRHPHSWSIIDEKDLVNWILTK